MNRNLLLVLAAALMVGAFVMAAVLYDRQQGADEAALVREHADRLVRDYSPRIGNPNAKVTIVEFFDPACGTCRAFHPLVKELMATYPGKINVVLRYADFHPGSDQVVAMLEAARLQGRFSAVLDAAYETQPIWAEHGNPQPSRLWMRLGGTGINISKALNDMGSPEIARRLAQDRDDIRVLQVTKTPTFYVNGRPLPRFGANELRNLVAEEVRASY